MWNWGFGVALALGFVSVQAFAQTPNGFLDFGTTADGTTATTGNTGFGGVRVGSGGGGFTIANPGKSIGSDGELRGVAPTSTSINSVGITSTEFGTAASTFTVSFELFLSGGASGTWYFFAGNGTSFAAAQSTGFTGTQVFTGLRWVLGASDAVTVNNRAVSTWNATGITGTPFAQNVAYQVAIVGNNSASAVNYGASQSVAANTYDLWVNGVLVGDDLGKGQLAGATAINAFRFYGESSTANVAEIALDNIRWYNTCVLPPTHLAFVNVPGTASTAESLTSFTVEARSGSASGPVATAFGGNVTVAKASGSGAISGTLSPAAASGVATFADVQFDAADTYTMTASAASPIASATSGNVVVSDAQDYITFHAKVPNWADHNPGNPAIWGPFNSWASGYTMTFDGTWWVATVPVADQTAAITYQLRFAQAGSWKYQNKSGSSYSSENETYTTASGHIWIDASSPDYWGSGGEINNFSLSAAKTTLVVLSLLTARDENGQVVIRWETSSEENTVGFFVERWDGSAWVRVNGQIVYASGQDGMGASYALVDAGASVDEVYSYRLVEVETGGSEEVYGPYDLSTGFAFRQPVEFLANGDVSIRWLSRQGETYTVLRSSDLTKGREGFQSLSSGIAATPPENTYIDNGAGSLGVYRITADGE